MRLVVSQAEINSLLKSKSSVMLKFSATWCGPCRAVAPVIEQMKPNYPNVEMVEVDLDKSPDVASTYNITAVPSFVFFKDGNQVQLIRGGNIPAIQQTLGTIN